MCCGALRRSTGCFNQQNLNTVNQPEVSHNPLGQLYQSTQSQQKSMLSQWTVNAKQQQQKVNTSRSKSTVNLDFSAQKCRLGKSEFWPSFGSVWPSVDQSQRWSNLRWKTLGQKTQISLLRFPRVDEEEPPRWPNQSNEERECDVMMSENVLQRWPIYIHQWGCVTPLLGLQAYISFQADLRIFWINSK